jgi:RNA polymerase sigma-70 factor, ECF subfamily
MTFAASACESLGPGRLPRRRPTWTRARIGDLAAMPTIEPQPPRDADAAGLVVAIAQSADREAFRALFASFAPRVKTYLMRHGASPAQAEDLAQETLLTVWRKAAYFDPRRASVAAWLFTIARNLRIDAIRRERSNLAYDIDPPERRDETPLVDEVMLSAERDGRVIEALKILPREQIEVIRLSFFQDKPHSEIANDLNLPLGTVKSRLRLAMARLKGVLGDVL